MNHPSNHSLSKHVQLLRASTMKIKGIFWLWYGWLAAGKLHILAGAAGTGKTSIALRLAAIISNGGPFGMRWPDGTYAPKEPVIVWSGEDSYDDTILPRLKAASADMNYIHVLKGTSENGQSRPFDFSRDQPALSREMKKLGRVSLVIIDSIAQAVPGDSHKNGEVRHALEPLVDLAEHHQCAILGITHFTKGSKSKDPLDRVAGSLAFGAVARVVMVTAKVKVELQPGEPASAVLVRAKSNIGPDDGGFEYCLQPEEFFEDQHSISTCYVQFNETPLEGTAKEILAWAENNAVEEKAGKQDLAMDFLRQTLPQGVSMLSTDLEVLARENGISAGTLKRAKASLGVISEKRIGGGQSNPFYCHLPTKTNIGMKPPVSFPYQSMNTSNLSQSHQISMPGQFGGYTPVVPHGQSFWGTTGSPHDQYAPHGHGELHAPHDPHAPNAQFAHGERLAPHDPRARVPHRGPGAPLDPLAPHDPDARGELHAPVDPDAPVAPHEQHVPSGTPIADPIDVGSDVYGSHYRAWSESMEKMVERSVKTEGSNNSGYIAEEGLCQKDIDAQWGWCVEECKTRLNRLWKDHIAQNDGHPVATEWHDILDQTFQCVVNDAFYLTYATDEIDELMRSFISRLDNMDWCNLISDL